MKAVFQKRNNHVNGDCLEASLASILEVDPESFPPISNGYEWIDEINEHLIKAHGLFLHLFQCSEPENMIKGYHLIFAESKELRKCHAMVGLNGKMVHDPGGNETMVYPTKDLHYGLLVKHFN